MTKPPIKYAITQENALCSEIAEVERIWFVRDGEKHPFGSAAVFVRCVFDKETSDEDRRELAAFARALRDYLHDGVLIVCNKGEGSGATP